jgi:sterol desaturase/sphingolipid hydroxylase (fatty acid hydroxylase superfamily)
MSDSLVVIAKVFFAPLVDVTANGNVRNYWIFILCSMTLFLLQSLYRGNLKEAVNRFFAKEVWWSPSAHIDYMIVLINPLIRLAFFTNIYVVLSFIVPYVKEQNAGEAIISWEPSTATIMAMLTISLFLVNDFLRWLLHYLQHRIPVLWEFHKVHHSAEALNFATAERFHPLDIFFVSFFNTLGAIAVNISFIVLWGDKLPIYELFGANILWSIANIAGGSLRHSPAWLRFGPKLERWFISPAMHQIHHSSSKKHIDTNFGGAFAVWDRWFGTIYIPQDDEKFEYGIGKETKEFRSLRYAYLQPFKASCKLLSKK